MGKLVLVRHSQPRIERNVPAAEWRLSERGRRRAEAMAARLRGIRANLIWCSREPKAVETAEILGSALDIPIRVEDGLEEHHRGNVPFFPTTPELEQAVEEFFRNRPGLSWAPRPRARHATDLPPRLKPFLRANPETPSLSPTAR